MNPRRGHHSSKGEKLTRGPDPNPLDDRHSLQARNLGRDKLGRDKHWSKLDHLDFRPHAYQTLLPASHTPGEVKSLFHSACLRLPLETLFSLCLHRNSSSQAVNSWGGQGGRPRASLKQACYYASKTGECSQVTVQIFGPRIKRSRKHGNM